jgi:hypothetical protein
VLDEAAEVRLAASQLGGALGHAPLERLVGRTQLLLHGRAVRHVEHRAVDAYRLPVGVALYEIARLHRAHRAVGAHHAVAALPLVVAHEHLEIRRRAGAIVGVDAGEELGEAPRLRRRRAPVDAQLLRRPFEAVLGHEPLVAAERRDGLHLVDVPLQVGQPGAQARGLVGRRPRRDGGSARIGRRGRGDRRRGDGEERGDGHGGRPTRRASGREGERPRGPVFGK